MTHSSIESSCKLVRAALMSTLSRGEGLGYFYWMKITEFRLFPGMV